MVERDSRNSQRTTPGPRRPGRPWRVRWQGSLARVGPPLVVGAVVAILLQVSGFVAGSDDALQVMGFDPDRARLITAMVVEALAVAAATIVAARIGPALVVAAATFVALYGPTFYRETIDALNSRGTDGTFDPLGWLLTATTVVLIVVVIAWAAASLARIVRGWLARAIDAVGTWRASRSGAELAWPLIVAIAGLLLVISGPVLGDMLNYAPDVRMRQSAPLPVGLIGNPAASDAGPAGPDTGPAGSPSPATVVGGGPAELSDAQPWLAWRPAGAGSITPVVLPGGWTGGTRPTADLAVYVPPGYGAGTRRYPVTYEVPFGRSWWQTSIHATSLLDSLIDSGAIPAQIVVFVSPAGGPYPDSECVDSADGREWFERWFTGTIVPAIDQRFRTLAAPAARALLGFSQGGYCASMLLLRHPNVVSSAVALSGYYESGLRSPQTPNAWRPFGGDLALIAATSPVSAAGAVPAALRPALFVILSGDPNEAFYGPQYRDFSAALAKAGIPTALLPNPGGHSLAGLRSVLPVALRTLAARQVAAGVFRG